MTEAMKRWILALRSGTYRQTQGILYRGYDGEAYYCCMGVACEVLGIRRDEIGSYHKEHYELCRSDLSELGIDNTVQKNLIRMNDDGESFDYIANYLESLYDKPTNEATETIKPVE